MIHQDRAAGPHTYSWSTAAYLLKRAGRRVVLLDRGRCAAADTGNTTAHLTCALDTPMTDLVASFGEDHARAAWDARLAAIARLDEIVRTERIDCHFAWVPGYLHAPRSAAPTDEAVEKLRREARQIAALGFDARFRARSRSSIVQASRSRGRRASIRGCTSAPRRRLDRAPLADLHPHGVSGAMEHGGAHVGLSLSRFAVRATAGCSRDRRSHRSRRSRARSTRT